jgi:hypothetical protein
VAVAEHLDLDMTRFLDELFDEHAIVTEAVARFVATRGEALERLLVVPRYTQALAAAACTRLDHHRVTDVACNANGLFGRFDRVVVTRDGVDVRLGS